MWGDWEIQINTYHFFVNSRVDVAAVQETNFICAEYCRVLENNFAVFSLFGNRCSAGVSQLIRCSLNTIVNLVFDDDSVADVAV